MLLFLDVGLFRDPARVLARVASQPASPLESCPALGTVSGSEGKMHAHALGALVLDWEHSALRAGCSPGRHWPFQDADPLRMGTVES